MFSIAVFIHSYVYESYLLESISRSGCIRVAFPCGVGIMREICVVHKDVVM
jgi:hypothetical protein